MTVLNSTNELASLAERLTDHFYRWEMRGRGWAVWPYPVELEPPFRPFFRPSYLAGPAPDDGHRPTFLSSLAASFTGVSSVRNTIPAPPILGSVIEEPLPPMVEEYEPIVELRLTLPLDFVVKPEAMEQFLLSLIYCRFPVSFELVGLPAAIVPQIAVRTSDLPVVQNQLDSYFPEVALERVENALAELWAEADHESRMVVDFGLSEEFMLPVRTFSGFTVDPLIAAAAALAELTEDELGIFQVLFQPARRPWSECILRSVTDWEGKPFFADAPQMLPLAKEKIARPLFAAIIRVAAKSDNSARSRELVRAIASSLAQFSNPASNEFIPLEDDDYPRDYHLEDLACRRSRRSGMLLNSAELVGLAHLPSASVRSERLKRNVKRTKAAPAVALGAGLILGENLHNGQVSRVSLNPQQRIRHTHVIGASGTGKSTLLLNLIVQDIENCEGLAVLDPHGDLIDEILGHIPDNRLEDVIVFDPADEEYPIGFNILSAHSELEKQLISSDLVAVFRRLSTSWGDQMTSVLGNAVLAILESSAGGTLADIRRFLVEPEFRQAFLKTVNDPEIVYYWQREFPLLIGRPQAPLLTRLDTFLRPRLIRQMVTQKENRIDFRKVMDSGQIFLAKLTHGAIGEENAYLLGTLLVSKIHQTAMSRQELPEAKRRPFYFYIDEFHNFVTPSMAAILAGARKYHLGLILAHQELHQLASRDTDVASAVLSNPYTRICFRVGDADAQKLEVGFSTFKREDLQNLGMGEAVVRVERSDFDFNLKTYLPPSVDPELASQRREQAVALSREKFAARTDILIPTASSVSASSEPVAAPPPLSEPRRPTREAPPPSPPKAEPRRPESPKLPAGLAGRGGQQHKYLQHLIKRLAEDRGYRAIIEKPILDGTGSVDVSLERDNLKIACEISVSTNREHELGNIQKCLAAGYDSVVAISSESKALKQVNDHALATLEPSIISRLLFFTPEEFPAYLDGLQVGADQPAKVVRGYKVNVKVARRVVQDKEARRRAVSEVIFAAVNRLGKKGKA